MQHFKTNKLKININFQQLLLDYTVIKFSTTENYIKWGALVIDEIGLTLKAKSIIFERGKSFYAMFELCNLVLFVRPNPLTSHL